MNANIFARTNLLIKESNAAYLGVIDGNGYPSVSAVSTIKPQDIFTAYFATGTNANKTKRLLRDNRASVCYRLNGNNITLVGKAEILTDQETKNLYWLDTFIEHFQGGKTDPNYCIIKFTTERVSLWVDNVSAELTIADLMKVQSRCGLLCKWCTFRDSHNCGGCIETNGNPFYGVCPVAACCQGKGYTHCGECHQIPCQQLQQYSCGEDEHCDIPKGARISVCKAWEDFSK